MAKKDTIISDFHEPKLASLPADSAASQQVASEGKQEASPDEAQRSGSNGKVVEKKN